MKKAAIFAVAAAFILSLAACGSRDDGNRDTNNNGVGQNTTGDRDPNGTTANDGITNGSTSSDNGTDVGRNAGNDARSRSSLGNDVRRGLDDVGDAVEDMWDDGRNAVDNAARGTANNTSFQQMLDNARVHDVDGMSDGGIRG